MNVVRTLPRTVRAAVVTLMILGALALTSPAYAHADLESTSPAADALVVEPLHAVVLELSAPPRLAWLTLEHRDGTDVMLGRPAMEGVRLTAAVGRLSAPGGYDLSYRVVTEDGHDVEGSYSFAVAPTALTGTLAVNPTDTQLAASPTRPDGRPLLWLLGAVCAVLVVSVVRRTRARRSPP